MSKIEAHTNIKFLPKGGHRVKSVFATISLILLVIRYLLGKYHNFFQGLSLEEDTTEETVIISFRKSCQIFLFLREGLDKKLIYPIAVSQGCVQEIQEVKESDEIFKSAITPLGMASIKVTWGDTYTRFS